MKHENTSTLSRAAAIAVSDLRIEARTSSGWTEIVKGVSFTLRRGEVLGIVGESGAGKSTIGLAALGHFRPGCRVTGGKIVFDGTDMLSLADHQRRKLRGTRIAYVAQSAAASFNPAKRLMDQVVEAAVERGGQLREEAEANAVAMFRSLQLPEPETFGRRYPHQVSGGQLQRAMTAMAMICRPDLIVFDEPTTALDVTTQVEVLISIRKAIAEYGVAALYISHDLAIVAQLAHRVMVLRYGEVVEEAPIAEILSAPKHPYTKTLWALRSIEEPERPPSGDLLQVRNISASYGTFKVLESVDLSVGKGQTVALVGESGSGKSTLGRVIAGLMKPDGGAVMFEQSRLGPVVSSRTKDQLRRVQIIYQSADTSLNPRHAVRKIIGRPVSFFHGLSGKKREARIVELLRMVELDGSYIDRMPSQLSGGQRQRVAIARALAADPELIICDEVTSALDQIVQADILKMLLDLQNRLGVSYLFITHDLEIVRAIADQVVVMNKGRIVEHGKRGEVLSPPYEDYTRLLLDSVPEMSSDWLDRLISTRAAIAAKQ
ncbi:ABC transporter ATP-binding protein [Mesorhizobium sp. YC-39]|uniref:ABC transporter ATP-binding protein n=1 Tax=unclassified Mesorhizobium TaxID=325217 RepID=UPI0021E8CCE5|nr:MULTISPECIES: ABC transporter ATP-binding protein [unclassified Mesorhizobium]MCV3210832.1 ABC transporter ATP-binding protein [Mesorhizobium sp. YC-2]MCV3231066.1 ABC transporter ATP-binding protein [Mesorhizobium sp. YC-39]